ncbi:hypothetical protein GCM10023189_58520 [Nibrella saemangeumensis]|uniref:Uncharacterized protein n=1 Tax=Nibrella saemangeumensis TaxID=1084526 RepID=A0ABP8NQW1_9BACT
MDNSIEPVYWRVLAVECLNYYRLSWYTSERIVYRYNSRIHIVVGVETKKGGLSGSGSMAYTHNCPYYNYPSAGKFLFSSGDTGVETKFIHYRNQIALAVYPRTATGASTSNVVANGLWSLLDRFAADKR